ncbi:hypothetical protein [Fructilactobacillus ixorae]|nr:hypothetical protein [Fructilactobacillus ixorae]
MHLKKALIKMISAFLVGGGALPVGVPGEPNQGQPDEYEGKAH